MLSRTSKLLTMFVLLLNTHRHKYMRMSKFIVLLTVSQEFLLVNMYPSHLAGERIAKSTYRCSRHSKNIRLKLTAWHSDLPLHFSRHALKLTSVVITSCWSWIQYPNWPKPFFKPQQTLAWQIKIKKLRTHKTFTKNMMTMWSYWVTIVN